MIKRSHRFTQRGVALPTALLFVLIVTAAGALLTTTSVRNFSITKLEEATTDSFQVAEGAVHQIIGEMAARPHLWRDRLPLGTDPAGYTEYSQLSYAATNGIPSCSGRNCLRNFFPTGGGLVKNFGPSPGPGDAVSASRQVWDQLEYSSLPSADLTLNGQNGFSQVERLDEVVAVGTNLGADMSNNPGGANNAHNIRFRVSGKMYRTLGTRTGVSTVVVIVEVPAT